MKLIDFIQFFDKYSFLFSFIYTITTALVGFLIGNFFSQIKKYKIRKCLSLTKSECKIILPSYGKKIHTNKIVPVCPLGDVKAASNIIDLIHKTGLYSHQDSIFYESNYSNSFDNYNVFCVGGLLANKYTYDIFNQFFPNFKILAPQKKIDTNPNKISSKHFLVCDKERGFCWGNSPNEYFLINEDERYAILIKLSNKEFNIRNHGTVHILFGNGTLGTLAISNYLLHDYKDLYKKVKGKDHYFIAFKVKKSTGRIDMNSFIDLTDKMFFNRMLN